MNTKKEKAKTIFEASYTYSCLSASTRNQQNTEEHITSYDIVFFSAY